MRAFVARTECAVRTEVIQFDGELRRWCRVVWRPDVHTEVGHVRRVDLLGLERDTRKEKPRVALHVIACKLEVFHVGDIPVRREGIDGAVGVGVTEE